MKKRIKIVLGIVSGVVVNGGMYGSYHVGYNKGIDDQLAYDKEKVVNAFKNVETSEDTESGTKSSANPVAERKTGLVSETQYGKVQLLTDDVQKVENKESNYTDAEYNFDGQLPNTYYRITVSGADVHNLDISASLR